MNKQSLLAMILCSLFSVGIVLGVGYWSGFINTPILQDFEILVIPSSLETYSNGGVAFNITLRSVNGFNKPVQLSTENVPSCYTATFGYLPWLYRPLYSEEPITLTVTCPANGEISLFLNLSPEEQCSVGARTCTMTIHGISGSLMHSKTVSLHILERSYEKLEIVSAYAVKDADLEQWNITLSVKNTGSTEATFEGVYINGKLGSDFSPAITDDTRDIPVPSGGEITIHVYIPYTAHTSGGGLFEHGTTIEVTLHTDAGKDYPQMISLP